MLGNFNPKAIQELSNLRAEVEANDPLFNFAKTHLKKTSFNTEQELIEFLKKLPDDECDRFISMLTSVQ